MKTIKDIVAELRKHSDETNPPQIIFNENGEIDMRLLADRIEKAHKTYNQEIIGLLKDVIAGVCVHCDMQSACQEGEDGMSTNCNAVAKAKHFIEQHTEPELNNEECPF